jgi:hypothetical protein
MNHDDATNGFARTFGRRLDEPAMAAKKVLPITVFGLAGAIGLLCLPGRASLPPLIESDYCYLLTAADRMCAGFGPTAPLPVAPGQPWAWKADWGFLTQWPVGYPALVCGVRTLLGVDSIGAVRWINLAACVLAACGWFLVVKRTMPNGLAGTLASAVAAASSLTIAQLLNPSTDVILIAAMPFVLLLVIGALAPHAPPCADGATESPHPIPNGRTLTMLAAAGALAGLVCWIRYAGVFLAVGVSLFLAVRWLWSRRRSALVQAVVFSFCAFLPMAALWALNRGFGLAPTAGEQFNLGRDVHPNFSAALLTTVWSRFTDFGFYDHHNWIRPAASVFPIAVACVVLLVPRFRCEVADWITKPQVGLCAAVFATFVLMIITASAVFGAKYNFAALDRYYLPVRPFYFALFVAPALWLGGRCVRWFGIGVLGLIAIWIVQVDWARSYDRAVRRTAEVTPYGALAQAFTPNSSALFRWLAQARSDELIVVSNFHEYILLETQIPALPIPSSQAVLDDWIDRIRSTRKIERVTVLFVLDPDNRWRDYWLPPVEVVIAAFDALRPVSLPFQTQARVLRYEPPDPQRLVHRPEA